MIPDNVIYTDGHNVTITDSKFQVKKNSYKLNGITKHGMFILKPRRMPAIILAIVGVIVGAIGVLGLLPSNDVPAVETAEGFISANTVMILVGVSLLIIGILILSMLKKKYAVRIDTAAGEENVVVSENRAYVSQIIDALNEAMFRFTSRPQPVSYDSEEEAKSKAKTPVVEEKKKDDLSRKEPENIKPVVENPENKEEKKPETDIHHHHKL